MLVMTSWSSSLTLLGTELVTAVAGGGGIAGGRDNGLSLSIQRNTTGGHEETWGLLAPLLLLAIYWVIWTSSGYRRRMSRNVGVGAGTTPPAPSSAGGAAVAAGAARGLGEGASPSPFG